MGQLMDFASGEMDDFQAQMLETVFQDVIAQNIDAYRDRIVVTIFFFSDQKIQQKTSTKRNGKKYCRGEFVKKKKK